MTRGLHAVKRALLALSVVCALPSAVFAQYQYYFTDTFGTISPTNWTQNGTGLTVANGLADVDPNNNGGSLISTTAPPSADYEVRTVLNLTGGGSYIVYLRATSNSLLVNGNPGTYYAVDLTNPTCTNGSCLAYLFVFKSVAGSLSVLSASQVTCRSGSVMRAVIHGTAIAVWMDSELYQLVGDTSIASGQPGVGVINTAATSSLTEVQFGPIDTTSPYPVTQQSIGTSSFPNRVDLQWGGVTDDPYGIGLAYYDIYRNGTWLAHTIVPEFSDTTVSPSTSYTYLIAPVDYHLNATPTTLTVQTAPAGSVDPRRVGVRPTGSYWGASAMGENLDLLSGNLNFSLPLLKPVSRGGWGVTLKLSYNSQNWRQDSGGTWLLGRDVGYGFGWRLMAGSLTPYYSGYWSLDHYVFTDSTGAEYRLTQVNNGVWTSQEGIYLTYDSNTQRLYFPDGSFWVMGCMSAGDEQDAGTMYPTQMEDTNGNQINITYNAGLGAPWANSSARINTIQDIRSTGGQQIYSFSYNIQNPPVPHLIGITNNIGTAESYTLHYTSVPLESPFSPQSAYGVTSVLDSVYVNGPGLTYGFTYDNASSGELNQVSLPTSGSLGWGYTNFTYVGSRTQPEVQTRSTYDGTTTLTYTSGRDPGDGSRTVHYLADWYDPSNTGDKAWIFNTSGSYIGLVAAYLGRQDPGYTELVHLDYAWTTDAAGNPYIGTVTTTNNTGQPYAVQKKVTQIQDSHGNLTQMQIYDWGPGSSTPSPGPLLRRYTNTYLTDSNYTSRYIFNRLLSSSVTDGTHSATLASNTYDNYICAAIVGLSGPASPPLHDAAYSTTFLYRGNATQSTTPAGWSCRTFDIVGNVVASQDPAGHIYTTNINGSTNYAAPSAITTNSLTVNLNWSPFLGLTQETGPNGDSSGTVYDGYARPASTTSPYGATTTYSYTANTTTATVNGRWTKTTVDGLGRPVLVETGYGSTTVSQVDSVYGPCACSPLGKLMRKSQPHAPNATKYWTTYTYDGIGRTLSVQLPDGHSTTTYTYWSQVVQVTDPAAPSHWKHLGVDGNGNLFVVREPNEAVPDGSQDFFTTYSYDVLNHLIQVSMTRPTGSQTRQFNYMSGNTVGAYLLSKSEPETGTTTYTYSGSLLQTKVDANNQKTQYTYDNYGRVTMIQHYPVSTGSEDVCQRVTFSYDSDPTGYSHYALGRQTAVEYRGAGCGDITPSTETPVNPNTFVEMYSYSQAGLIVGNKLLVSQTAYYPPTSPSVMADLEASYTYDNEGKMTGMTYPSSSGSGFAGDNYTYTFDSLGRPVGMTDQTTMQTAVSGVTYGPAGEMLTISYGGINEGMSYNSLLQLTGFGYRASQYPNGPMGMTYTYSATNNNGKIQSQTDAATGEVVSYQYDALNRLIAATSNSATAPWGQEFKYDQFGNLTDKNVTSGSAPTYHATFNSATNRENGPSYDANGNQITIAGITLGYDVENRITTAHPTGTTEVYSYGRGNRRVYAAHWQWNGTKYDLMAEKVSFYSVTGQKLGTYQLQLNTSPPGPPSLKFASVDTKVWFGSRLVNSTIGFETVAPDRLGSFGTYYPYGEERGAGNPPADREKFATYTRDSATGLDYAVNRYYYSVSGRFLSADPHSGGTANNPGSWNRYSYAGGDPAGDTDPSGLAWCPAEAGSDVCEYLLGLPDDDPGAQCVIWAWEFGYSFVMDTNQCINMSWVLLAEAAAGAAQGPSCDQQLEESIDALLTAKGSPLAGYSSWFVALGQADDIDPRLMVAMAGAESSYGTSHIATVDNNPFGIMQRRIVNRKPVYLPAQFSDFGASITAFGNILDYQIYNPQKLNNTVDKLYSGQRGAYCVDSPGFPCSNGDMNVTKILTSLGGDPNRLGYPCPPEQP